MAYSVTCECGKVIEGLSERQMNFNLQIHKKSKNHKDSIKKCSKSKSFNPKSRN